MKILIVFFLTILSDVLGFDTQSNPFRRESPLGNYSQAAISIDGKPCAQVGLDVLLRNGTAVDAAIAALFCNGVHVCHSMGIGGGLVMTVYKRATETVETLIARERAPIAATEDMFHGDPDISSRGPLSIGVPGQILGFWEAKEKYGNPDVSWSSLIQPTIDLCRNGITVSPDLAYALKSKREYIFQDVGMSEIFVNSTTGDILQEGDVFVWPNLANTLSRIAENGAKEFYEGQTAQDLIADLSEAGSIITLEDLKQYRTQWQPSLMIDLDNGLEFHGVHPPASGAILAYILNIVKNYNLQPEDLTPLLYHRITESFKWAYAMRTKLGDPSDSTITDIINEIVANVTSDDFGFETFLRIDDNTTVNNASYYGADFFLPEDYGTTHMGVISSNGDAVAITSTINQLLGSIVMSKRTGIILNDEMDDFSSPNITSGFGIPPSPNNFIKPGKIPLSSTCPTIILDKNTGDVRLVTGASGGTKITSQTAMVTIRNIWLEEDLKTATDAVRFHHQLMPMEAVCENSMDSTVVEELESKGHSVVKTNSLAVVNSLSREKDGRIYAYSDMRKDGSIAGF